MTAKDFLTNHNFIKWVNHPDQESDTYWKSWMAVNPEHLPQLKLARELLLRARYEDFEPRLGAKQRILENILNSPLPVPVQAKPIPRYTAGNKDIWQRAGQLTRVAAILLVSILLGWLTFPYKGTVSPEALVVQTASIAKSTGPGEKLQFTLPDGSSVWLNSASEMSFPERFDGGERMVKLTGEAFFEVKKDSLRPFKVMTNGVVTTALGTSFNVKTKFHDGVKVSLLTGKVKVKATSGSEDVFLDPGQELLYNGQQENITVRRFEPMEVTAWREGRILFKEASLPEVVNYLEDWYGVKIHLQHAEGVDWEYSGEYKNQTLDNVLNSLSYIQKFKYSIQDKNVEIKF